MVADETRVLGVRIGGCCCLCFIWAAGGNLLGTPAKVTVYGRDFKLAQNV